MKINQILIILLVTLAVITGQIKCSHERSIRPRGSLRSFSIRPLKTIRDMIRAQELQEAINNMVRNQELKAKEKEVEAIRISKEEMSRKNENFDSNYGDVSFFKKFFHFDRI